MTIPNINSTVAKNKSNNTILSILVVFTGSVALYLLNIYHTPDFDELYHILAARGVQETGTPAIAEGVYERVYFLTWIISKLYDYFGESLLTSRIPSLVPMALVNCIIYVWLCKISTNICAWIATALFATSPYAFDVAQYTRFYGLQTLCFLIGALSIYYFIVTTQIMKKLLSLATSLIFLYFAAYFQKTSLIGIAAITIWVTCHLSLSVLKNTRIDTRSKSTIFALAGLILLLLFLVLLKSGIVSSIWSEYRTVQPFNRRTANEFWYYHMWFNIYYPTLWPLFGMICISAIARFTIPAIFCITIFSFSFLLNSFAPNKDLLYLMYAQPFIFMIVGMSMESVKEIISKWFEESYKSVVGILPFKTYISRFVTLGAFTVALLFLVLANSASIRTMSQIAGFTIPPELPDTNWEKARSTLNPLLDTADIVITMTELEMLYYFDDYDLLYSESRLAEIPDSKDFSLDFRTGRPVIGSLESLEHVFDCYQNGIFVTTKKRWKKPNLMTDDIVESITSKTQVIDLPKGSRVVAYKWSKLRATPSRECEHIRSIVDV